MGTTAGASAEEREAEGKVAAAGEVADEVVFNMLVFCVWILFWQLVSRHEKSLKFSPFKKKII